MNSQTSWIVGGLVVVILVALGLWYFQAQTPGSAGTNNQNTTATTTDSANLGGNKVITHNSSSSVASIATSISGASTFAALLSSTGVLSEIKGAGPYTIFVPTDGAFSLLASGTIQGLSAAEKKTLVEHHVVVGRKISMSAVESGNIEALSGGMLNFEVSDTDETPRVNNAFVVEAYYGTNGTVFLISGVLFPSSGGTPIN